MARYIIDRASAGMIGVNVGVPVPREPFSVGGSMKVSLVLEILQVKAPLSFGQSLRRVRLNGIRKRV